MNTLNNSTAGKSLPLDLLKKIRFEKLHSSGKAFQGFCLMWRWRRSGFIAMQKINVHELTNDKLLFIIFFFITMMLVNEMNNYRN
jgi:hypothetical protein